MRLKRLLAVLVAGVLAIALASDGALAQAAPQGTEPIVKPGLRGLKVTLKVRMKNVKGAYYCLGKTEVYRIANEIPEILDPLVKSGETVTIEARASGDLLIIETLNGQKYEAKSSPEPK
jgi:hypothetical protein